MDPFHSVINICHQTVLLKQLEYPGPFPLSEANASNRLIGFSRRFHFKRTNFVKIISEALNGRKLSSFINLFHLFSSLYDKTISFSAQSNEDFDVFYCSLYLGPGDYHWFHSPTEWTAEHRRHIPGTFVGFTILLGQTFFTPFCDVSETYEGFLLLISTHLLPDTGNDWEKPS